MALNTTIERLAEVPEEIVSVADNVCYFVCNPPLKGERDFEQPRNNLLLR